MKFISTVKFYCISGPQAGPQDLRPRRRSRQPGRLPPYLRLPLRTPRSHEAATHLRVQGGSEPGPAGSFPCPVRGGALTGSGKSPGAPVRVCICGTEESRGDKDVSTEQRTKKKQTCSPPSQARSSTSPFFVSADLKSVLPGAGRPCGARVLACFRRATVPASLLPPSSLPFVP